MLIRNFIRSTCFGALTFLAPYALFAQDGPSDVVEIAFTQDMDKADLERIREEVKTKGVDLTYESMSFKDGRLHAISFGGEDDRRFRHRDHGRDQARGSLRLPVTTLVQRQRSPFSVGSLSEGR
jgi:hypothetical protein